MMKKGKKLLAIVISSIMVLSAFAEGDYTQKVYADEKDKSNINSSSNAANTTKNVEAKIEIKKGLVFTDKKTSAVYKITKVNKRKEEILGGEVTLVKTTNKKVTNLKISERIQFDGIGFNAVKVGNNAYKNCKKLKKLIIGKNIRIIGKNAFKGCKKLKRVEFRGDLIKKIGKNAFAGLNKKVKFSASIRIYEKYFS